MEVSPRLYHSQNFGTSTEKVVFDVTCYTMISNGTCRLVARRLANGSNERHVAKKFSNLINMYNVSLNTMELITFENLIYNCKLCT